MAKRNCSIALALKDITKSFDQQKALLNAVFSVKWGELHALLGENGAGKSTLMNVVCGLYTADDGQVEVDGEKASISDPQRASALGIGMVHQHFKLIESFTVAENLLLSCGRSLGTNSLSEVSEQAQDAAQTIKFTINPRVRVSALSVAERQRVEVTKLILLGADILVLDEPTAVLTDEEAANVLKLLRLLASQGKAVVLITHRLNEVLEFSDRVTVMRSGQTVVNGALTQNLSRQDLASAMVGDDGSTEQSKKTGFEHNTALAPRLQFQEVAVKLYGKDNDRSRLSFDVSAGEVFGVAGVGGNGQTELTEALIGLTDIQHGTILVDQVDISNESIARRRKRGLRLIPADRFAYALLADLRNYENLALTKVPANKFGGLAWLSRSAMKNDAEDLFRTHQIIGGSPNSKTRLLSGGNAQKLLLARELDSDVAVLIAHSPTRGLDIRAYQAVHETIRRAVSNGAACLLISEDLEEVLSLSSKIGVMNRGVIHGPYRPSEISRLRIGELMAGHV